MKRICAGIILILTFLLVCWHRLATEGSRGDTPMALFGAALFLLIPGAWLTCLGWRSGVQKTHPMRKYFWTVTIAATLAPFAWLIGYLIVEDSRCSAVVEPLRKGAKLPTAIEPAVIRFVENGANDRAQAMVRVLIREAIPGTEPLAIKVLELSRGDPKYIAEMFLKSGNSQLEKYAKDWAPAHGYQVVGTSLSPTPRTRW